METDWEFEVGNDAPVIDGTWDGFIDLRQNPERASEFPECAQLPGLAVALQKLNGLDSPVLTSKCDVWTIPEPGTIDLDELDASADCATCFVATYIDLLSAVDHQWALPENAEAFCVEIRARLRAVPLRCCRIDLVVRRAIQAANRLDFGITAYIMACGANDMGAGQKLEAALAALAASLCAGSTLQ